ncbi:DUF6928 family protein [Nocardioides sp. AE5]|uniref:DUF6928 family protein n=1 Tax=Nocardioides sp. AE5 TaxID=2962573 RepID=UPI002881B8EC|nr:hypothetical protein [Nocardioides sp. AE5]MDT0203524.1 hypothetical protein [Nocardioides sp. AE5]
MGVNLAAVLYPDADPDLAPEDVVRRLFPRMRLERTDRGSLISHGFPERGEIAVGHITQGLIITTRDAALFRPTDLHARYAKLGETRILLTQQTAHDMFAFARWSEGALVRALSVNPVGKVWQSIGDPDPFEAPFWSGEHPVDTDYPLPFHPLEMAEAAVQEFLGTQFEASPTPQTVAPESIVLDRFARSA